MKNLSGIILLLVLIVYPLGCSRQSAEIQRLKEEALQKTAEGNISDAIALYQNILQKEPNDEQVLNNLGQLFAVSHVYDKAEEYLLHALELNPDNATVLNNLGSLYLDADKLGPAQEMLERSLKIEPNNAKSLTMLASLFQGQQKYEQALVLLDQAIQADPSFDEAYFVKGFVYMGQRNLDEAEKVWRQLHLKNPLFGPVNYQLSILYHSRRKFDQEGEILKKSVELGVQYPVLYSRYAYMLEAYKQAEQAITVLEKALTLKEKDPYIYYQLGFLELETHAHTVKAEEYFKQAYRLNPKLRSLYHTGLAWSATLKGKYDIAENYFRLAQGQLMQLPVDMQALIHYYFGKYNLKLGKEKEAELSLLQVRELDKNGLWRSKAEHELQVLSQK
ncbi:tetratricopeptide repeat protein [bacterium]|nr:tetratricopeptide repeat protein [bacterium]